MKTTKRILLSINVLVFVTFSASAQIVVNSLDDDGGSGDCELREAITNANNDDQSGSTDCAAGVGDDTIDLTGLSGSIVLTSQLPVLTDSVTIQGPGPDDLLIDADRVGRVFYIGIAAVVTIDGVTITGGQSSSGAGIRNEGRLTVSNSVITDNISNSGAGIYNQADDEPDSLNGFVLVLSSEISNNRSALYDQGNGGGINNNLGTMIIDRSTISGNHSRVGGGIINWYTMIITNSTISGNSASNGGGGMSISIPADDVQSLTLEHSTVADNSSDAGAGGLRILTDPGVDTAHVSLYSSIIAGNGLDISGHVTETRGYNILGSNALNTGLVDGVGGDQVGTSGNPIDPRLFALGHYGGATRTHLPKNDSPAIDSGSCTSTGASEDQRGIVRAQDLEDGSYPDADDGCDIGAVELLESELSLGVKLAAGVFLEGPFAGGSMSVAANGYVPTAQPFVDPAFNGTPLDYDGTESVISVPADVVDWLLLGFRTGIGPETELVQQPAFLTQEGEIVGLDGDTVLVPLDPASYHVVVRNRNHMSVMSVAPVDFSTGVGEWDFRSDATRAYTSGGNPIKSLGGGAYGMFASDGNSDGQATAPDFNLWNAATTAGATGYEPSDYNMDGQVTAPDFNLWNANTTAGAASQVPD